jgi:hypothetical protein
MGITPLAPQGAGLPVLVGFPRNCRGFARAPKHSTRAGECPWERVRGSVRGSVRARVAERPGGFFCFRAPHERSNGLKLRARSSSAAEHDQTCPDLRVIASGLPRGFRGTLAMIFVSRPCRFCVLLTRLNRAGSDRRFAFPINPESFSQVRQVFRQPKFVDDPAEHAGAQTELDGSVRHVPVARSELLENATAGTLRIELHKPAYFSHARHAHDLARPTPDQRGKRPNQPTYHNATT